MCSPQPFLYFHFNRFRSLHKLFYRLGPIDGVSFSGETCNIGERKIWSANNSYNWLTNEYIPYVISINSGRTNYAKFMSTFRLDSVVSELDDSDMRPSKVDSDPLKEINKQIMLMINNLNRSNKILYIKIDNVRDLYKAIALCLKRSNVENIDYVKNRIDFMGLSNLLCKLI